MTSTAIAPAAATTALIPSEAARGFVQLQTLAQAREFADILCKTDFVPKDYVGKPGNAIVAMQMGMEIGLPPLQAIQSIAVVNGRPALWGDGLRALILSAPDLQDIQETDDGETASCSIVRAGRSPVVRTFSMTEAKLAGLAGGNVWAKYPKRMRQNRAFAFAARDAYADRLRGISSAEEQDDVERTQPPAPSEPQRIKDVTPRPESQAPAAETMPAPAETKPTAAATNGATDTLQGVTFTDTAYIPAAGSKAARWEITTAEHGTLYVLDEQLAKSIETCVDTGVCFAVAVKMTKASTGIARIVTQIDPEDGGER